ncbi:unnamed protein product [Chrysodeixis includens]|uniref:Uncharacterized protein n=1 Tax=Chrysodeixis includens TaxID=689277 RepID=A0A9P0BRX7_CHRIL|nr:unnamed protein product [Chrysodeixis includens]
MACREQLGRVCGAHVAAEEPRADIPIIRRAAAARRWLRSGKRASSRALPTKTTNFPFHCIEWSQLAHHNKRITRRLARAHCKQCVSGIPSLFMRDHIPEGFLLFAFQLLFIFFLFSP